MDRFMDRCPPSRRASNTFAHTLPPPFPADITNLGHLVLHDPPLNSTTSSIAATQPDVTASRLNSLRTAATCVPPFASLLSSSDGQGGMLRLFGACCCGSITKSLATGVTEVKGESDKSRARWMDSERKRKKTGLANAAVRMFKK